jgi:threonine synthase
VSIVLARKTVVTDFPLRCSACGHGYQSGAYVCTNCGGIFDLTEPIAYDPAGTGFDRYQKSFPLPDDAWMPRLGEGNTPLVTVEVDGRSLHFKCEYANPTGSFKDRGTAVLVASMVSAGIKEAVEDSSGNAGASFAAYAARAGIAATVFIPDYASGPKRAQIEAYGANLVRILGPRSEASKAVRRAAANGAFYASHAHLPQGLSGMATLAFEIVEQLGRAPDAVVMPVGQGTLLIGAYRGFQAMQSAGAIETIPKLIGVQALQCAPLWAVFQSGGAGLAWTSEGSTIAEGIRITHPVRGDRALEAVEASGGSFLAVDEHEIQAGMRQLANLGFWVEPTSAVVWQALESDIVRDSDTVVAVLTGSGLKTGTQNEEIEEKTSQGMKA